MGGGSAPKPDENIGIAAMKSAEVGEDLLAFMKKQASITNQWASEDRRRWKNLFRPLQNEYIRDAKQWDSPGRIAREVDRAISDVRLQGRIADGTRTRQEMALGLNPASGRSGSARAKAGLDQALAAVGAGNLARDRVQAEGSARMANAINLGSGLAVNPATSMGLSNGAVSGGANGAMAGYGQQGSLLNTQYNQQMQTYQANQQEKAGMFQALGTIAGMASGNPMAILGTLSTKKAKTDKTPMKDGAALGALRKMPVEEWTYRPGMGDGGRHIGPYAEDFHKATGKGDGTTIPVQDQIGITMGAVRDLAAQLDRIEKRIR
ncbi:tail fiber domain-containing protein [Paracoccus sp. (in: a-proteobacteria)]|uniref:tail fiber domain-containing protein n=1 Tax=Paracoccus sp. TaxID=267 RepID=UPI003A885794